MTKPISVSAATAEHYTWGGSCDGWRLLAGSDLSVIEERAPAGASETWHRHRRARQFFYLLSGQAEVRTELGTVTLRPGDGVEVSPGLAHQFANPGPDETRFLVISSPATQDDRELAG